eukprot:365346-Chlamydomonas_euryale.AAC.3
MHSHISPCTPFTAHPAWSRPYSTFSLVSPQKKNRPNPAPHKLTRSASTANMAWPHAPDRQRSLLCSAVRRHSSTTAAERCIPHFRRSSLSMRVRSALLNASPFAKSTPSMTALCSAVTSAGRSPGGSASRTAVVSRVLPTQKTSYKHGSHVRKHRRASAASTNPWLHAGSARSTGGDQPAAAEGWSASGW